MVKITVLLILSITLVATWFSSYVAARYPAPPNLYVQVAPWWHIGLFVAWAVVQLWANQSMNLALDQQAHQLLPKCLLE